MTLPFRHEPLTFGMWKLGHQSSQHFASASSVLLALNINFDFMTKDKVLWQTAWGLVENLQVVQGQQKAHYIPPCKYWITK